MVVDVLRCTFSVETPEEALEFERSLLGRFPLVRSKNGHHEHAVGLGGYADRKFSILLQGSTAWGDVALVVEVQQLLTSYLKLKAQMHGCYRVARGDYI